jgi:hypothetical protein
VRFNDPHGTTAVTRLALVAAITKLERGNENSRLF